MAAISLLHNAKCCPSVVAIVKAFAEEGHNCVLPTQGTRFQKANFCMICSADMVVYHKFGLLVDGADFYHVKICGQKLEQFEHHALLLPMHDDYLQSNYCHNCGEKLVKPDSVPAVLGAILTPSVTPASPSVKVDGEQSLKGVSLASNTIEIHTEHRRRQSNSTNSSDVPLICAGRRRSKKTPNTDSPEYATWAFLTLRTKSKDEPWADHEPDELPEQNQKTIFDHVTIDNVVAGSRRATFPNTSQDRRELQRPRKKPRLSKTKNLGARGSKMYEITDDHGSDSEPWTLTSPSSFSDESEGETISP